MPQTYTWLCHIICYLVFIAYTHCKNMRVVFTHVHVICTKTRVHTCMVLPTSLLSCAFNMLFRKAGLTSFHDNSLKLGLAVEVLLELLVLCTVEFLSQNSPLHASSLQNFTALYSASSRKRNRTDSTN